MPLGHGGVPASVLPAYRGTAVLHLDLGGDPRKNQKGRREVVAKREGSLRRSCHYAIATLTSLRSTVERACVRVTHQPPPGTGLGLLPGIAHRSWVRMYRKNTVSGLAEVTVSPWALLCLCRHAQPSPLAQEREERYVQKSWSDHHHRAGVTPDQPRSRATQPSPPTPAKPGQRREASRPGRDQQKAQAAAAKSCC